MVANKPLLLSIVLLMAGAFPAVPQRLLAQDASPAAVGKIAYALYPFVERHALAGAVTLVADKEKLLSLEAIGFADVAASRPMRPDSLFWIASQSKPITATALMMLVDEGKVRLDDPVEKYLPEFKGQWLAVEQDHDHMLLRRPEHPVTVRHILSHTSGMPFKSAMEEPTLDLLPLRDAVRSYAMTPLQFEPGSKYQYSNAGINTAGRIIEVVSGIPYEEFLQKRLFEPLGMKDTTFWPDAGQLARLAKSYKPNADEVRPRRDNRDSTQVSARRPQTAANARRRPVLDGPGCRALLPDDSGTRRLRGEALSFGSVRRTDDQQANGPPAQRRLRSGLVDRRRPLRPRRSLLHEHDDRPGSRANHGVHGSARWVSQRRRQEQGRVRNGGVQAIR